MRNYIFYLKLLLVSVFVPFTAYSQTNYFTQGAATTSTTVNTYATDTSGFSQLSLGSTTFDFMTATELIQEQDAAVLIHAYVTAGWTTPEFTGDFSLDDSFPSFSGSQAMWVNPNNAPYVAAAPLITDPQNVSSWGDGTWQVSLTFNVSDVALYTDFFIEGRHYGDDIVTATLNGMVIALPSKNIAENWNWNPPATSSNSLASSLFVTGDNVILFTIDNTNPEVAEVEGPSGLMAFGRIGATLVPEPSSALLLGVACVVLLSRRNLRRLNAN